MRPPKRHKLYVIYSISSVDRQINCLSTKNTSSSTILPFSQERVFAQFQVKTFQGNRSLVFQSLNTRTYDYLGQKSKNHKKKLKYH